jgi:hypothetical protein
MPVRQRTQVASALRGWLLNASGRTRGAGGQDVRAGQRIADDVSGARDGPRRAPRCATSSARARRPTAAFRDRLVAIAVATIGFDVVCGVLGFLFEHDQKQTQIKSLGSAVFWTSTQMLTVSSNIQNPISFPGRVLDVVMEVYAITVIGSLAGALGAFLVKRGEEIDAAAKTA